MKNNIYNVLIDILKFLIDILNTTLCVPNVMGHSEINYKYAGLGKYSNGYFSME